jgi:hypothetical protein
LEDETGNGRGELEFWKDRGGKLIDFKAWLIGHKGAKLTGTFSLAMPVKFERKCGRILTERDLEDTTIATQSRIYAAGSAYG